MPKERAKIYIRNSSTNEIRWKYTDQKPKGEWPNYEWKVLKTGKNKKSALTK
jgi:hypothetical protein